MFRARDDRLGRDVAVKVLKAAAAADPDRLRRFEQEARAAAVLNHPNIVAVYDIGVHEGTPYIVSELLEGQTLRQRLMQGPFQLRMVTDYVRQLADGLMAAHERHIVHRDLKPENVLITRDGHVKILDFGIAKLTSREASDSPADDQGPTQTKVGVVLGTVGYMSPEQLRGKSVDHRTDIFSFGSILYEMLTGKRAFVGETEVDTMLSVLNTEPPEIALVRQNVPDTFDQIIRHCLEKEPENRFQSTRDLSFALGTVTGSSSKQVVIPDAHWKRIRKRWPWIAATVLLVGVGVWLGAWLRPAPAPRYRRITFERGTVYSARFRPDGRSILYSAAWNGQPLQIYSTVGDAPQSQPLDLANDYLFAISPGNELALGLRWTHGARLDVSSSVLARSPLAGGTPREVLENVVWADWSPSGELAVVRHAGGHARLEFPIGKVLYETSGDISNIRFSPKGDRIAYMDHPEAFDDRGTVCITDLQGHRTTLSRQWQSEDGLAWTPAGAEIWFAAAESSLSNRELWAVNLSGHVRRIFSVPGGFTLHDIASDGRVLVTMNTERLAMEWVGQDPSHIQDLSWYDWSIAKDFTHDGQWVLFEEGGAPAGPNYSVAIRRIDGSPPIRLGDGTAGGLSPNGKWAISVATSKPPHLTLLPVGAGQAREVPLTGLDYVDPGAARFMPDGRHILVFGSVPGKSVRGYLVDSDGVSPMVPITPDGVGGVLPSPDGKYLAGLGMRQADSSNPITLFPTAGGNSIPLSASYPPYVVCQWANDSRALYVYTLGQIPLSVFRLDVATGKISPLRELIPADRAGVVTIAPVACHPSGNEFAFSFYQTLSVMYVITGLR